MSQLRTKILVVDGNKRKISRNVYDYFRKEPDIMQVRDIVKIMHCSKNTVYALIKDGRLGSIRVGRSILVPKTALVEMIINEKNYIEISEETADSLWTSDAITV